MKTQHLSRSVREALEAYGAQWADILESDDIPYDPDAQIPPLLELRRVSYQRWVIEQGVIETVRRARAQGISWHKIGTALQMTGEAARKRYQKTSVTPAEGITS
ncbi:MAG: hypothetical protein LBR19_05495 [Bifidobacteriaceae bacterium]|jgi:hypothetical protein|nr:hypothetical protein [Bifidobacteriaceae bacterium]